VFYAECGWWRRGKQERITDTIDELPNNIIKTISCQSEANKKLINRSLHSRNYSSDMKFSAAACLLMGAVPGAFGVYREVMIVMASTGTAVGR
jgi:hypothetical protein